MPYPTEPEPRKRVESEAGSANLRVSGPRPVARENEEPRGAQPAAPLLPAPADNRQLATGNRKRRYTVTEKMREAARANLMKARAVAKDILQRATPRRAAARMRNLEHAWERQRDPHQVPGGPYRHGAYSKDLRRTAPLSGADPNSVDRLQERLRGLFPPRCRREGERLAKVGDRLARVWRVMASWAHRERLLFYWALEQAAAEPRGVGVEHVERLAQLLDEALDFSGYDWLDRSELLDRQQNRLRGAMEKWESEMAGETGRPKYRRGWRRDALEGVPPNRTGLGWGLSSELEELREQARELKTQEEELKEVWKKSGLKEKSEGEKRREEWAGILARAYAAHPWALPEMNGHGEELHAWLVKAAVVGGDHVHDELAPEVERAIGKLASATWRRMRLGWYWQRDIEEWSWEAMEEWAKQEQARQEEEARLERLSAAAEEEERLEAAALGSEEEDPEDDAEEQEAEKEKTRRAERAFRNRQGMREMAKTALEAIRFETAGMSAVNWENGRVQEAMSRVIAKVKAAVTAGGIRGCLEVERQKLETRGLADRGCGSE